MYRTNDKPFITRFDMIRTIASVVSAICLLALTIGLLVAGAYTSKTITKLQSTYHPERLGGILSDASDTMHTIHQTTTMLKSSRGDVTFMDDIRTLMHSVEDLSVALTTLHIDEVLKESSSWRQGAIHIVEGLKKTLANQP